MTRILFPLLACALLVGVPTVAHAQQTMPIHTPVFLPAPSSGYYADCATTGHWSAFAVSYYTPDPVNFDLALATTQGGTPLITSTFPSLADVIFVDGNNSNAPGTYVIDIPEQGGTGSGEGVELSDASQTTALSVGTPETISIPADSLVRVHEIQLTAGTYDLSAQLQQSHAAACELFVIAPSSGGTWYENAAGDSGLVVVDIVVDTTSGGGQFTAPSNGTYAVVALLNYEATHQVDFSVSIDPVGGGSGSAPATAPNLTITNPTSDSLTAEWTSVTNATDYELERSPDGNSGWTNVYTGSNLDYTDTGLSPSTDYYYRVRATNSHGQGPYSTVASESTSASSGGGSPPSAAPSGLTVSNPTADSLMLEWDSVSGASGYSLQRSLDGNSGWSTVFSGNGLGIIDSPLSSDTVYYYRVQAENAYGSGPFSTVVSGQTSPASSGGGGEDDPPQPPDDTPSVRSGSGCTAAAGGAGSANVPWLMLLGLTILLPLLFSRRGGRA